MVFLQQHYKKMVQLVSEKRDLYRDKLQLLLQTVAAVPTDTVQQEMEDEGDSPCSDNAPCDGEDEQFFYDDHSKYCDVSQCPMIVVLESLSQSIQ